MCIIFDVVLRFNVIYHEYACFSFYVGVVIKHLDLCDL